MIPFLQKSILKQSSTLYDNYAWRITDNEYHALVAEMMLQRTNADQVLPVYIHFSETYKTPEEFLKKNKTNIFKTLGLPQRQKYLKELSKLLKQLGYIPNQKSELLKLPGVGDYVASAFLSLHTNQREVLVDSNIVRFYSRFFGFEANAETRRQKWFRELAEKITPNKNCKQFNYGLLDFTRKVCKAKKPVCEECVLASKCEYLGFG
jgi:A/G-specific adenine glycosylase